MYNLISCNISPVELKWSLEFVTARPNNFLSFYWAHITVTQLWLSAKLGPACLTHHHSLTAQK